MTLHQCRFMKSEGGPERPRIKRIVLIDGCAGYVYKMPEKTVSNPPVTAKGRAMLGLPPAETCES